MPYQRTIGPYEIRMAVEKDIDQARSVMLDTFYHEFGHGYMPQWHRDVIDPISAYLRPKNHALFVALKGEEVVGTTGVRAVGPRHPPHPRQLAEAYPDGSTAQLFRVYVRPEHRRCGLASALVGVAREFIEDTPSFEKIYLHTDTRISGAESFWKSTAQVIHDDRSQDLKHFQTLHFEMPITR